MNHSMLFCDIDYNNRGSSPSLPAKKFFWGRETYFFRSAKKHQKNRQTPNKESPFLTQ